MRTVGKVVCVTGGRDYWHEARVFSALRAVGEISRMGVGDAQGADALARRFAAGNGIPCTVFVAEWGRFGNRAGPIRNKRMLLETQPDVLIAFPGGRGTGNCIQAAEELGIKVLRHE